MEILIKILEIILIPITYFAGVQRGERKSNQSDIDRIAQKYLELVEKKNDSLNLRSIELLITAGIQGLKNTKDKRKVFEQIKLRGKSNTFEWYKDFINKTDKELEEFLIIKTEIMNAS